MQRIYYMRKNGEKLNERPRIELSTIHGAKGGEADNVMLLTELPRVIDEKLDFKHPLETIEMSLRNAH